jgi:hypothetical protein
VRDKVLVEVAECKKGPCLFHCGGDGPVPNSVKFSGVHSDVAWFNDHAKIFHLFSIKRTLLWFQK